jgi:stearoyl-CoA desaturase (delta-9 desaturase)
MITVVLIFTSGICYFIFIYFRNIGPSENKSVSIITFGEGWHNYHHVFPWDYKAAELGNYNLNFTTAFIDFFAKIGWAYDRKCVPVELIRKRIQRTGDGGHKINDDATHIHQKPDL